MAKGKSTIDVLIICEKEENETWTEYKERIKALLEKQGLKIFSIGF